MLWALSLDKTLDFKLAKTSFNVGAMAVPVLNRSSFFCSDDETAMAPVAIHTRISVTRGMCLATTFFM